MSEPFERNYMNLPFVESLFPRRRSEPGPDDAAPPAPTQEECEALWDKYSMLPNIRDHSRQVALVVGWLGARFEAAGVNLSRPLALAGALLHDLAKSYTIRYGGSHSQLGAGWVVQETGHYRVAQMVYYHVHWPWEPDIGNESMLPSLMLLYADKRVKHDRIVTLEERFADLMQRYGVNEAARQHLARMREQGQFLERAFSERLGVAIDEYSFDCRRLV